MEVRQIFEGEFNAANDFLLDCAKNDWKVLEIKLTLLHFPKESENEADETTWYSIVYSCPLEAIEG